MSKLEKVIKKLENLSFPFESSDWAIIEDCTDELHELNKPVQYVVNYRIINQIARSGIGSYSMARIVSEFKELHGLFDDLGQMRVAVLAKFNKARLLLSLPLITIEQITFVEV